MSIDVVRPWYAVKRFLTAEELGHEIPSFVVDGKCWTWLEDTCAGGSYSVEFGRTVWYDSAEEARDALVAAELELEVHGLVRLEVNPAPDGGNHYLSQDVPWP